MKRYISRKSVNGKPCALRGASTVWRGDCTNLYSETVQGGAFLPYHWTGHSSRLKRNIYSGRRTTAYAREELVAEIGSMFISCAAKIPQNEEVFNNHASYVDGWLECIKNDSNAIFKAAADANRAADYILTKAGIKFSEEGV